MSQTNFPSQNEVPEVYQWETLKWGTLQIQIRREGDKIGEGPHSQVYKGVLTGMDEDGGRIVTIIDDNRPVLNTDTSPSAYDAIHERLEILREIHHPFIAEFIEFIPNWRENRSAIIMQYIEGKGLNQLLIDDGAQNQNRVLGWACQLLDALDYLHGKRLVHGRIRPNNVVITDGNNACLVDFQYLSDEIPSRENSQTGSQLGLNFEKYEDAEKLQDGISKDIHHLGRTLFHALTDSSYKKCASDTDARALLKTSNVTDDVVDIVMKAIGNDYHSAMQMLTDIHELPRKNAESIHYRHSLFKGFLCCGLSFLLGLWMTFLGYHQIAEEARQNSRQAAIEAQFEKMRNKARESGTKLLSGDYSGAKRDALESADWAEFEGEDLLIPEESEMALVNLLGVYNPIDMYLPFRSDYALAGQPQKAAFSPSGQKIAVVSHDLNAVPSAKRLQIFDTASAREKIRLTMQNSDAPLFAFLDDDTILYAGEQTLRAFSISEQMSYRWTGDDTTFNGRKGSAAATIGIAVSSDGATLASVNQNSGDVYIWKTAEIKSSGFTREGDADSEATPLPTPFPLQKPLRSSSASDNAAVDSLIALSGNGDYLALSFPDGTLYLYRTDGAPLYPGGPDFYQVPPGEDAGQSVFVSRKLEGGFCGNSFFCSFTTHWLSGRVTSYAYMFHLPNPANADEIPSDYELNPVITKYAETEIHTQADETGFYYSIGNSITRIENPETDAPYLSPLATTDGDVLVLRHAAGKLLAVTSSEAVLVYREDGAWKTETATGNYSIADLSEDYLFLVAPNRKMLSVLKRNADKPFRKVLRYDKPSEERIPANESDSGQEEVIPYSDFENHYDHVGAHIREDGKTVMLFQDRSLRIYDMNDGSWTEVLFNHYENNAPGLFYLRNPVHEGSVRQECLKVIFDHSIRYYSAENGQEINGSARSKSEEDYPAFQMENYFVWQNGGNIVVEKDGVPLREFSEGALSYASQAGTYLIITVSNQSGGYYSLLMNAMGRVCARIPTPCEALPDGRLIFDDRQGQLLEGERGIYPLEEILQLANKWEKDG